MLRELNIKDYGIFAQQRLVFEPGLTVLTGETGAGKSLLVGAIGLILGGRANSDDVRAGCDEAVIEALFERPQQDDLVIRRVLQATGRSRITINGVLSTAGQLAELARELIDFSGQHEQQILLNEEQHLQFVDQYAGNMAALHEYQEAYQQVQRLQQEQAAILKRQQTAAERLDYLQFRLQELDKLQLKRGESEELQQQLTRMQHASKLFELVQAVLPVLSESDGAVLEQLGGVRRQIEKACAYDAGLTQPLENLQSALTQIDDVTHFFQQYAQQLNFDPSERDRLEARLFKLGEISRKYGSLEEALRQYEGMRGELNGITDAASDQAEVEKALHQAMQLLQQRGAQLSQRRQLAVKKLAKALQTQLQELAMENAKLAFELRPLTASESTLASPEVFANAMGLEKVTILFSANPGEALRPLAKIASGGELSRLLLALKLTLRAEDAPSFIFDEIDTGIGGRQAESVGRKMRLLATQGRQVFCVTHLAPIAAYGDHHLKIAKEADQGRTVATIKVLQDKARITELARMLAGEKITDKSLSHAQEMLQNSIVS